MALRADDVDLNRDSLLVERFQSGDQAAFDDLYRRYYSRLVRFCLRRVGDPHEAEEVAQEAFTRAYRALPRLAGERRFYPWMTVIAGRLCVDSHRRRARTELADVIDLGTVEADLDDIFATVDHEYLAKAMARLAPRHQEVLQLRERDGWSAQRIADHYAVNVGTAEALLHRARRSLRRGFLSITRDGGLLAGAPLLGALGRRITAARNRLAAWAGQVGDMATPLAV
ncbi:MAG: polymerase subunit sigma, partial [Acidimicrobiales bacterium]|nr:polymerase subunit sigma [Acidimicrobiales bacterium]